MEEYSFLIIHGLDGSGPEHWQSWLYHELKQRGYHAAFPSFSDCHSPNKDIWLKELSAALKAIPAHHKKIIITHSLGGLLWQHFAAAQNEKAADYAILIAPPSPSTVITAIESFFPVPLNRDFLIQAANETLFVHSSNDPYCTAEDTEHYLKLNIPSVTFQNAGHINTESGHGKWPWILDVCLNIVHQKPLFIQTAIAE